VQSDLDHNQEQTGQPESDVETAGEDVFIFPATVAQHRFWLLDQLQPGNPALNIPLAARLTGLVDAELIERVVNEVVKRHEILRTSFRVIDGDLVQIVHSGKEIPLARFDVTQAPESERDAKVNTLILEEGRISFALATGPLFRAGLIKLRNDEHILLLTMHHIGSDGWSNGILIREVAQLYNAFLESKSLPDLPLQYADFAMWQQDWLKTPAAAADRQFWQTQLQGTLQHLNLPTDYPRQATRSNDSTIHTLLLPARLTEALKSYCNSGNLTLFMVFLTAYAVLLRRYSGQSDITIGSPAANRNQPDLEGLIGLFSNPLLMRLKFSPGLTLHGLMNHIKVLSLEVMEHQAYPFEKVVEEIQTDPRRAGVQWLQAYMVFQKAFMQPQRMGNGMLTPLRSVSPGAMFDWMLGVLERAEGIRLQMEYNTSLFEQSTVDHLLHQFQALLETIVTGTDCRIDELPILTPKERQQLVSDWNESQLDLPTGPFIHALFEEQAMQTPDAPALQQEKIQTSYSELNLRANKLAHFLRGQGLQTGCYAALAMRQDSIEFVVGFLAILKAGGCCLHFDLPNDAGLLERLVTNSKLGFLVVRGNSAASLMATTKYRLIDLDKDASSIDGQPGQNPSTHLTSEHPACVSFTARSRNGAIISHQALSQGVLAARRELELTSEDCVAFSPTEMLPALLSGAKLVCHIDSGRFNATDWWQRVRLQAITVAALPTICWHELVKFLQQAGAGASNRLRLIAIGGGQISPAALPAWQQIEAGRIRLVDRFLLAEAAGAIAFTEPMATGSSPGRVSIARPAPNTRIYLLDDHLNPVPIGVPGHLYVGGSHLASDYVSAAETPGSAFVADPILGKTGDRLIETGDTGRFLPAGGIELLGRIDDLKKTNGFRLELCEIRSVLFQHPAVWDALLMPCEISGKNGLVAYWIDNGNSAVQPQELQAFITERLPAYMVPDAFIPLAAWPMTPDGRIDEKCLPSADALRINPLEKVGGVHIELQEIEKLLSQHPAVRQAVAVVREDSPGDPRVVAYLAVNGGEPPAASQLLKLLRTKLPEHRLPSTFVTLKKFPLTPDGKVDHGALPAPDAKSVDVERRYVAPRNHLEHVLCNLWRDVLKLQRVGVKDDFFALGGHSLLAVRLISEINKHLETKLHVPAFFQNRTIERLAAVLAGPQADQPGAQLIRLRPGPPAGALIFLNAEIGLCRLADLLNEGQASFATAVPLSKETYRAASHKLENQLPSVEALAALHTSLIKSLPHLDPCILVGHSFGGLLAFEVAHQLQKEGRRVEMIFLLDAWAKRVSWWQKFPIFSFERVVKSLQFRASFARRRLLEKLKRLATGQYIKSTPAETPHNDRGDVNVPYGEIPWEIYSTIYHNAIKHYRKRPLQSRAVLFRARDINRVGTLDVNELHTIHGTLGWSGLFKQGLEIVDCSGDHTTILKQPNLQFLADQISARIQKLRSTSVDTKP
jgi:non-ribosomal peptide synthetase component F/thioesterase domain-containing protein